MPKQILSLSGGKDSTAMLLKLIEDNVRDGKNIPIDEVVFFDTGMEFKAVYDNINYLKGVCKRYGDIPFATLPPRVPFEEKMFNITVKHRDGTLGKGYSWCGGVCRWGTTEKLRALEKHCGNNIQLIGIAADETHRMMLNNPRKTYPLIDFDMTEPEALQYCYRHGCEFREDAGAGEVRLYDILDRVSCWCCGNKNLKELRNIYLYLPQYWERLKDFQSRTSRPFRRDGKTIFDLEERFLKEVST